MNKQDRTMFYILGKDAGTLAFRAEPYNEQIEEAIEWLTIASRSEQKHLVISFYEGLRDYCQHQDIFESVRIDLTTCWKDYCESLEESSQ